MSWIMVYVSVAVVGLSVLGACCAKSLGNDPGRLVAVIAAAALWPVLIVGLLQFGAIHLMAGYLRRKSPEPAPAVADEAQPVAAPLMLDSLARV